MRTPTLIFHSRHDQAVPFSQGEELAAGIPGAHFVPLESRNHILLANEPAWPIFADGIRAFLGGGEAGARPARSRKAAAKPADEIRTCTTVDGTHLAYASSGSGFPLVKAQNWITNLNHDRSNPGYRHWIAEGSRTNRFVRSDMRGFGLSEHDPATFTFEAMVGDLATIIDDAGVDQCDLLGIAHGAAIAIAYAARNPERVRKLVLVNGFAAGWRVRADPEEIAWRNSLMDMNQREWSFRRSMLGEMFLTLYFPNADAELIDWHNKHFDQLGPVERTCRRVRGAAPAGA